MRLVISTLMVSVGLVGALYLSPALAAEPSTEIRALSAEVQALQHRQMAMQADIQEIRALLAGGGSSPTAAKAATDPAATAPASDADTAAIKKELEELRQVVAGYKKREEQARQAQLPVRDIDFTLAVGNDPFKGATDARITLVEFTDYQCPFCERHHKNVLPELLKNFVDTGKVRYVLRDYPLNFHQYAAKAHEAAHCAGGQGKYWEMNDQLFANQKALQLENLASYAENAGVADKAEFQSCLDSGKYAERGQKSLDEGAKAGVSGTPSFLLGLMEADGSTVKATKFIRGAQALKVFEEAINEMLTATEG